MSHKEKANFQMAIEGRRFFFWLLAQEWPYISQARRYSAR